jgi:DNA-directed RNA polymerase II subunit RPB1
MSALSKIRLRYYTDDEIRSLGVVCVTHSSTYDRGVPKTDGINDSRMGLIDHTVRCPTCFKANCDQHFGYIQLHKPVYRLGTINSVLMILRSVCRECARPKFAVCQEGLSIPAGMPQDLVNVQPSIMLRTPKERLKFISEACRTKFKCHWCDAPQPVFTKRNRTFIDSVYRPRDMHLPIVINRGQPYIEFLKKRFMPDDAASILFGISKETADIIGIDRPLSLICTLQIVPPPIIRPSNFAGESKIRSENDLTTALQDVVRSNIEFKSTEFKSENDPAFYNAYDKLQVMVSGITNHAIKRTAALQGLLPMVTATSKRKVIDLKTRLNGKKARVRGNLSGKRVDQSGRTVISGDASHDVDQLGVPSAIMNKLTFPEPVTSINLSKMAAAVIKGAYQNNGALAVQPPNHSHDHVIWLPILDKESRIDLASQLRPGWIVERHLMNDDWVLFNRQPSLWKASMMAFRCYRVEGLTARLPLPVTRAFNADFDGDEMNIHALQGYEAIAEAKELMRVDKQIITPQSGTVIIGLVQDSLVGAWRLSAPGCFFSIADAQELCCAIDYGVPGRNGSNESYNDPDYKNTWAIANLGWPAILIGRPKSSKSKDLKDHTDPSFAFGYSRSEGLYTGLYTGLQIASQLLPKSICLGPKTLNLAESHLPSSLIVHNGDIMCGRLSKSHLGASNTGFIQSIWRLHGPGGSLKFISDAQRLFVKHLSHDGPSQSIIDCLMNSEVSTNAILSKHLGRSDAVLSLDIMEGVKESKSNSILQETLRSVGASVLSRVRQDSALADCVNSGAKGNVMNIAQIGGCVGQQNIYGKRVPVRQSRLGPRTLVYYAPGDLRAEARGFVANSYMSGLTPAEFFEHQMAGREGIVATAVNTSETGYNQRRMIKGQESQCIGYDGTVRVSSNIVIQSFYGGDDLDGSRLERIPLNWLPSYENHLGSLSNDGDLGHFGHVNVLKRCSLFALRYASWHANLFKERLLLFPCAINVRAILTKRPKTSCDGSIIAKFFKIACSMHARHHASKNSLLNISICCATLQLADYLLEFDVDQEDLDTLFQFYTKGIVAPGEGVGALGASSIGEPSMQKTLNTFHYTGIADKNVTITGLPRFKQLINGADTYDTANMSATLKDYDCMGEAIKIGTVMLSHIIKPGNAYLGPKVAVPQIFESFGLQRGPLYTKFSCSIQDLCSTIVMHFDWTKMFRKSINIEAIVRSLRDALSFDAIVNMRPHWLSSGPGTCSIEIILAPWISHHFTGPICEALLEHQKVRGLDFVKNAIVFQEKFYDAKCHERSSHIVETEGSNLRHFANCSSIVPESVKTTNVPEICAVLGIGAGVIVLQSELHKVLSFDGSYIDPRHTWLLADTMARSGSLSAMNRHHMPDLGSSLLQEASFERSLDVFEEGAVFGRSDNLAGATERIIVGQPVCIGTGLVGIVAEATQASAEIMVPPLDTSREHHQTTIVRPLNFKAECDFDPSGFSLKLSEMDRIAANDFTEQCASHFRNTAASKRTVPSMRLTIVLKESSYKSTLKECNAWTSWSSVESMALRTDVFWSQNENSGVTIISYDGTTESSTNSSISFSIENYASETRNGIACDIYGRKKIDLIDLPFSVDTTKVVMRHETIFTKGHFKLILGRQWEGLTNVETENSLLKDRGKPVAILEMCDAETILMNRCTDAQLGNAIWARLPKI